MSYFPAHYTVWTRNVLLPCSLHTVDQTCLTSLLISQCGPEMSYLPAHFTVWTRNVFLPCSLHTVDQTCLTSLPIYTVWTRNVLLPCSLHTVDQTCLTYCSLHGVYQEFLTSLLITQCRSEESNLLLFPQCVLGMSYFPAHCNLWTRNVSLHSVWSLFIIQGALEYHASLVVTYCELKCFTSLFIAHCEPGISSLSLSYSLPTQDWLTNVLLKFIMNHICW